MTAPTIAPTTYTSPRGTWKVAAKHTRGDDGIDVVLAFHPAVSGPRRLYGFRYTLPGGWRQVLIGHAPTVPAAVRAVAAEDDTRAIAYLALVDLLNTAACLPDHPAVPGLAEPVHAAGGAR